MTMKDVVIKRVRRKDDGNGTGSFLPLSVPSEAATPEAHQDTQHFVPLTQTNDMAVLDNCGSGESSSLQGQGFMVVSRRIFFFVTLVAISTGNQAFYKLSQRNGSYAYNTLSAMVVVEGIKLALSLGPLAAEHSFRACAVLDVFRRVERRVYAAFTLLAISYAAYNQLIFHIMEFADPGTFSLFKSLAPAVVGFLNFAVYGSSLTQAQILCILVQICGIVPVAASTDATTGRVDVPLGARALVVIALTVIFAAFNTVYNASLVKKESANYPMNVQNSILYMYGCGINLMSYFANRQPGDRPFFYGYDNLSVILLLFLHGTTGITISMVYKYGDAVLKTLAQPVVSSILLVMSYLLFDVPFDIVKLSGAGTVILSTILYLKLPPAEKIAERVALFRRQPTRARN